MEIKTIWNVHLLDKLYSVDRVHHRINDEPIMRLEIEDRNVSINGITVSPSDCKICKGSTIYYLNREEAELKLKTLVL